MPRLLFAALMALSAVVPSHAANQAVLGNQLLVQDPGMPEKRKIVFKGKEASGATIVGDPTTMGALLEVRANGATSSSQAFDLPAGTSSVTGKPFWRGDASKGYKYKDPKAENGPVKAAQIKKSGDGVQVKATMQAKPMKPISVTPPSEATDGCVLLTLRGGDSYSLRFADGTITTTTSAFKVRKPTTKGLCVATCDFLDQTQCLFPFPSDYLTIADPTTETGRRVHFSTPDMPRNSGDVPIDASPYSGSDGFSQGSSILLHVAGIDLAMTGAAPITDVAKSLEPDSPIVVVNATTGAHHLQWAELDANATSDASRALIIRPAVNFDEGTRYIVALRNLKDGAGDVIPSGADFQAYRDDTPTGDLEKEARRPHMEEMFSALQAAGVARDNLYLAWDFTVASRRNVTERLLFMRDDAFARLGSAAPTFTVDTVDNDDLDTDPYIYRRVTGTFDVERYVDSTTAPAKFVLGADGLPIHQATKQPAAFDCIIPRAALANAAATADPARASIYGHGLLGSNEEVGAGNVKRMANEHNFVFCATKWIGMSEDDISNALAVLQNLSNFPTFTDRLQQAMVNQLFLARLMIHPQGFVSHPAFQDASGNPVIDTSDVFYDGNSQGGIFGGTVMAVAQDITRGVLGVPGMNYSLLLTRSVDFAAYSLFLYPSYTNEFHRPLGLALIQMLWDRSEPNGYARHITNDPLPDTPQHFVLLHEAFGDYQVANVATEIEARTIGAAIHQPAIAGGRHSDVDPYYGIAAIPGYPYAGSAMVVWDSGADTPPITNTAPPGSDDPHSDPRNSVEARNQKSAFLQTGGTVIDVCSGSPCVP